MALSIIYRWHFACIDLQTMLSITLAVDEEDPDSDENTIQSTIVDGLGFYATEGSAPLGFYVDVVSFSSELRQFYPDDVSLIKPLLCICLTTTLLLRY